jgi:hypothetical protein
VRFVTIRFTMHACIYTYYYSYFSTILVHPFSLSTQFPVMSEGCQGDTRRPSLVYRDSVSQGQIHVLFIFTSIKCRVKRVVRNTIVLAYPYYMVSSCNIMFAIRFFCLHERMSDLLSSTTRFCQFFM